VAGHVGRTPAEVAATIREALRVLRDRVTRFAQGGPRSDGPAVPRSPDRRRFALSICGVPGQEGLGCVDELGTGDTTREFAPIPQSWVRRHGVRRGGARPSGAVRGGSGA
jgi:hypothetical protein